MKKRRRIRIFDLLGRKEGFPVTEVGNTAGRVEFGEKNWSYVLDVFEITFSHLNRDVKQAVGCGI